jgi:CRISPR-associated Csx2 family protein
MTTLISFLGRVPKTEAGYRKTRYLFPDGQQTESLAFFGWALHERLAPRRLIVLGTAGSMWDHLFEGDIDLGSQNDEERLALIESVGEQAVRQAQLDALAPALSEKLGCETRLALIPYARDQDEQIAILETIAKHVEQDDTVHLDITHGFRHLPMLALLSALHLRITRNARILGIWYGAFDPDTGQAPVHDLSGLLRIADGLQALSSFDKDGDYGVFEPLLSKAGLPHDACQALRKAAYYETILNVGAATGELRRVRPALEAGRLTADAKLLLPAIRERLNWIDEDRQFEKQTRLARRALQRGDYLRATLYAYEAVITRLCQLERVLVEDFDQREQARKNHEERLKQSRGPQSDAYFLLKNLRNQVAHGTRGSMQEVQQALLNEQVMKEKLADIIASIEDGRLPVYGQP